MDADFICPVCGDIVDRPSAIDEDTDTNDSFICDVCGFEGRIKDFEVWE